MDILQEVVIGCIFLFVMGVAFVCVWQQSRWPELKDKFNCSDDIPIKLKFLQSGIINGTSFHLSLALGTTDDGIIIKYIFSTIFIPYSDLLQTTKRRFFKFTIFVIKNTDFSIGLDTDWTEKIKRISDQRVDLTR